VSWTFTAGATSGGGGDGSGTLRLVFVAQGSTVPVPGVHVVLHTVDGVGVERYLVSDAAGVADFGNVGRARVTVTLAGNPDNDCCPELYTYVKILTGAYTVNWTEAEEAEEIGNYTVTYTERDVNTVHVELEPGGGASSWSENWISYDAEDIADSGGRGNVAAFGLNGEGELVEYGYLFDFPITSSPTQQNLEIPLTGQPTNLVVSSSSGEALETVGLRHYQGASSWSNGELRADRSDPGAVSHRGCRGWFAVEASPGERFDGAAGCFGW